MHEEAVGKCRSENRAEISVANGKASRQGAVERTVLFYVVADGIHIIAPGTEKAVHLPAVILNATTSIRMIGIRMSAACVVRRQCMRRLWSPIAIDVCQASLDSICVRQPAQQMIEAPVFHHQNNYVLNA